MPVILSTSYFPNIEYFFCLLNSEEITIATGEIFPKQTYRNRCVIMNANGLQNLIVPVERDHLTRTADVKISYAENWTRNHLRSIESAYRRAPYYEYYIESIERLLLKEPVFLVDLNIELTHYLVDKTGLSCKLGRSENSNVADPLINSMMLPKNNSGFHTKPYLQTFEERFGFQNNLSMLDLLFNEGPGSISILQQSSYH